MKRRSPALVRLVAALSAALALPAVAETTAADTAADNTAAQAEREPINLDTVEVEGQRIPRASSPKLTQPLLDTPQTITIVPRQVIKQRAATSLRDVLRNVSGISLVAGEGGGPQGDALRIRGFSANTDLFVDGVRDIAQYSRDPFNLESVEVSKGPASAYGGRGSTGGSINLVSKAPGLREFANASLLLGTDQTRRITADFNQPLGETSALRLNVMTHESTVEGRNVVENERWGIAPSLSFGLGTPTRVDFSYFHMTEDNIPDHGLPLVAGQRIAGVDGRNWYGFRKLNTEQTRTDIGTVKLEHDLNDHVSVRNLLRYGHNERYGIFTPPRNPNNPVGTVTRNPTGRDSENELLLNQTDLTIRFGSDRVRHTVVAGLELAREEFSNQALVFSGPDGRASAQSPNRDLLFAPNPDTVYTGARSLGDHTDSRARTSALYAFDTVELGERWQLNAGLRHDRFDARSEVLHASNGSITFVNRDDHMTSGRASVVYKPRPNGSIYVAYGTSFNPSAETGTVAANPTAPTANASVLVAPEKNRSYEVGSKWDVFDARLQLSAALFRTDKTNARTPGLAGEDFTVLDGEQRIQGFEFGAVGRISEVWSLIAGYSYLDSEILRSNSVDAVTRLPNEQGNPVANTPKHSASLWTTYQLPGDFEVGIGAQYVGERTVSNTVTAQLDDYTVLDAMLGWKASGHWDLRLNLFNLADEFYIDRVHAGGSHGVPAAGRTAYVSVGYSF